MPHQNPNPDPDQIAAFFTTLYPDTDTGWLVLSAIDPNPAHVNAQGKPWLHSTWLDVAQAPLPRIAQIAARCGTYFGIALQQPTCTPDPYRRSTNTGAYLIPGLWCDLDLAYGAHAASRLPATDGEALDFLQQFPTPPSLLVHSGGGMYGYWLFKEPWRVTDAPSYEGIRTLVERFALTLVHAGTAKGWTLDSCKDLARVLRPAGTVNGKYGRMVEVIHEDAARYNPSDFDWCDPLPTVAVTSQAGAGVQGQPALADLYEAYNTTPGALTKASGTEWSGAHPMHGSTTGLNFWVDPGKGLWHCFRHNVGGDALALIAVGEGVLPCEAMRPGALRGTLFQQVLAIAEARFGMETRGRSLGTASPRPVPMLTGEPRSVTLTGMAASPQVVLGEGTA